MQLIKPINYWELVKPIKQSTIAANKWSTKFDQIFWIK